MPYRYSLPGRGRLSNLHGAAGYRARDRLPAAPVSSRLACRLTGLCESKKTDDA